MLDHFDARASDDCAWDVAHADLLIALDVDEMWRASLDLVTSRLACHSCSLLYDIDGLHPRRGLHHLAAPHRDASVPVTSLSVAAPFLATHPRIRAYTFSQIAAQDRHAAARLLAQDPAPQWREFVHMAFWHDTGLEAVLSIRLSALPAAPATDARQFLADLHPLVDAALRRIRRLHARRMRLQGPEPPAQVGRAPAIAIAPAATARHGQPLRPRIAARTDAGRGVPGHHAIDPLPPVLQRLSPSERRVAAMVGRGMRNAAIAEQLCRSPKTIETQLSAIYRKLDIQSRTQLACLLA